MRQAPPLREQARGLRIAPLTQRILDRMTERREARQDRAERNLERSWERFREHAVQPIGDAPERPNGSMPCTSIAETTRQWESLQRFRLFTALEGDALERRFAVALILRLLRENVEQLRAIAALGNVCVDPAPRSFTLDGQRFEVSPLPSPRDVVAAIVTEELARAALGSTRSGTYISAPSGGTMTDAQSNDLAAIRAHVSFGLEPVPNGVLVLRPEIDRVLAHLSPASSAQ